MLKFGIKNNDKMKIKKSKHEITMVMVFVIFTATCLSTFLERKASKTLPPSRGKMGNILKAKIERFTTNKSNVKL